MYREERVKGQEWEEECKAEGREVPRLKPHTLLVAMGDIKVCVSYRGWFNCTSNLYMLGVLCCFALLFV